MSAEYSVEEVRNVVGYLKADGQEKDMPRVVKMLTAYANLLERIKADEAAGGRIDFKGMWNDMSDRATTHPPAQAAQVDEKVVVIRDGQATTEGLVLAAAIYMGAVKDIFALRSDGPPYNERKVTKDVAVLRAFDHLDSATKALRSAISHFAPDAELVAQFVETYWNLHANGEVSFVRRQVAEFPEWVLESNTYDVFRSLAPIDGPASKR